jgi:endonuclease YncB( thermonuclease family)
MSAPFYRFITGKYVVIGFEPDGDSVHFLPDDPSAFNLITNAHRIKPTKDGSFQLRLELIDAPETHYGGSKQALGDVARDKLMAALGFTNITLSKEKVTGCTPQTVPAAILTKGADVHGRPISYLVGPDSKFKADVWNEVTATELKKSLNFSMVESGAAYYTGYSSTPVEHRQAFAMAAHAASVAGKGVWSLNASSNFKLADLDSVNENGQLILPKLFRRCVDFLRDVKSGAFAGNLADWMIFKSTSPTRNENDLVVLGNSLLPVKQNEVPLSGLLLQHNDLVSFQPDLNDIFFIEK